MDSLVQEKDSSTQNARPFFVPVVKKGTVELSLFFMPNFNFAEL